MNPELIPGNHSSKEFQLRNVQFPAHHKKSVITNENQSTIIKKSSRVKGERVWVKFKKSREYINYLTFPSGWTKLRNIHRISGKPKPLLLGSKFTGQSFTEKLSRGDSTRALRQAVIKFVLIKKFVLRSRI